MPQTPLAGFGAFLALFAAWLRVFTSTDGFFFDLDEERGKDFLVSFLEDLLVFFDPLEVSLPLSFLDFLSFFSFTVTVFLSDVFRLLPFLLSVVESFL